MRILFLTLSYLYLQLPLSILHSLDTKKECPLHCSNKDCHYLSQHLLRFPSNFNRLAKNKIFVTLCALLLGCVCTKLVSKFITDTKQQEKKLQVETLKSKIVEFANIPRISQLSLSSLKSKLKNIALFLFLSLICYIFLSLALNKNINFYIHTYVNFVKQWPTHKDHIEQEELKDYFDEIYSLYCHVGKQHFTTNEKAAEEVIQLLSTALYTSHTCV
jgi:uncharacterized membrane protein